MRDVANFNAYCMKKKKDKFKLLNSELKSTLKDGHFLLLINCFRRMKE